jgi:DNA-binding NarL/FixJ family response regulator
VKTRILLVAHESVLAGLNSLLGAEPDFEVIAAWSDWWKGVTTLTETEVDLCVMDISRPSLDAELAIRRFKQRHPLLRMVALVDERDYRRLRLVGSGVVTDHVLRTEIAGELVSTIRRSLGGLSLVRLRFVGALVRERDELLTAAEVSGQRM